MRSSPRFHRWLHQHKVFGPILENWQQNRAVSSQVKKRGTLFIVFSFALSIYVVPIVWVKVGLFVGLIVLLRFFLRLPVIDLIDERRETD